MVPKHHTKRYPDTITRFWATVSKTIRPMISNHCLACPVQSVTLVYCGQTVELLKMKLGMQVAQPRPHCFRWGLSSPPQKGAHLSILAPCSLWPNGWMDQDATWYGGRPRPRRICVRWGPSSPPPQKEGTVPNYRPMSIVAEQLDGSRCHMV